MKRLLDKVLSRETIGHPDCPLMLRWTFFNLTNTRLARFRFFDVKAMIHYFPPGVEDKDPHDHPRSFLTFVLRGAYLDVRWKKTEEAEFGEIEVETVVAPTVRFRPAEYMHIVETFPGTGCWTLVLMGPARRPWGFLQLDGPKGRKKWWPWERYVAKFGGTVRCDTDDGDRTHELERSGKQPPPHVGHNSNHMPRESWRPTDFPD